MWCRHNWVTDEEAEKEARMLYYHVAGYGLLRWSVRDGVYLRCSKCGKQKWESLCEPQRPKFDKLLKRLRLRKRSWLETGKL